MDDEELLRAFALICQQLVNAGIEHVDPADLEVLTFAGCRAVLCADLSGFPEFSVRLECQWTDAREVRHKQLFRLVLRADASSIN